MQRTLIAVDDVPGIAELISKTAQDVGFQSSAITEWTTFSRSRSVSPDLFVLDLQMPGTDGIEVIRELAAKHTESAVILVSGLGLKMLETATTLAERQGLRVMGALAKPFLYEDLFELLLRAKGELGRVERPRAAMPEIDPEGLRNAIGGTEIVAYYQPIMDVRSGTVAGLEALARWQHPALGTLAPGAFLPVAERCGVMEMLNWRVMELAVRELGKREFYGPLPVSVNFCADDFKDLSLPDRMDAELAAARFAPEFLNVELTEGSIIKDLSKTLDTMIRLRMKGVGLWLDDFGTGYSSMEQLKRLPLSALKIDQSFTPAAGKGEQDVAILRSMVELAHTLGLPAIAEGVETVEQLNVLRAIGCDRAQGFYFAKPMPADALPEWLGRHAGAR